ncbi:hypothetical protein [Flavobacterium hibisci]|uniref:hypothetical protein n=1 Tax=Flavobacterium hibisci TaxID=1914462 RepID=UPI001CBBDAE0|nr:hypothetical protein [Flavobacterium hibisci]MBZ4044195.1 hypothetical protein [Flavobacterium hibisci]
MNIHEYCNKIKALSAEENIPQLSDHIDLENIVSKILQDINGSYFTIADFFEESVESVILNNKIVKLFSDRLGLLFSGEKEAGNVCFANSSELRSEFRQNFTAVELLDYVYAFAHCSFYKESRKVAITSETDLFWKLVKIGSCLKKTE